ncbi:SMP-30/gluconolactonase/LRE family protein [Streptomyces spiramenti]|uniref:SMP-30/gluconolactonase/LRE family protein n=1 Tax=Streptomyces spiramenti TaxID=2720606 RepID=A0ABX1AIJ6_9ACTN|nr:SMP-30/gluconolactonase/LRE family protein [Streptomyces spiramenti]NJP65203.1 SMP-30/gluconolactonase/LRE family protein [Streptomyces spiramenti]
MRYRPIAPLAAIAMTSTLLVTGCGTGTADTPGGATPATTGRAVEAQEVMRLTEPHPETGMTLLEGPTFGPDGRLVVVDVTAPEGEPKVMAVELADGSVEALHTEGGAYTSAQFSPYDGRLYLSDYAAGEIVSLAPDGGDAQTFFSEPVDGARMKPDDVAFDEAGNLYVSDSLGLSEGENHGRVVRISRDGTESAVLADNLAATNGISFDAAYDGLWFSELTANRISYLGVDPEGDVTSRHTAIRVDGGVAQTDSIAVDADGNLYVGLHGRPAMVVYSPNGERIATVEVPPGTEGLESATNVAITPGGTAAYMTVSGPSGGYLYSFDAFAEGTRQSNGG